MLVWEPQEHVGWQWFALWGGSPKASGLLKFDDYVSATGKKDSRTPRQYRHGGFVKEEWEWSLMGM